MATETRPNFFLLLGLPPDADWDQAAFERALRQKRGEWSRQGAGVAKKALVARQNLALFPTITEVMNDPELREKEAKAARKEMASARQAHLKRFEQQLALMNAKDAVDQNERDLFINTFRDLLPPEEIRQRLTVPLAVSPGSPSSGRPVLEESLFRSISDRLRILQRATLYDLLQRNRKTATPKLLQAADALYIQTVRLPPVAETTAKIELAGLAKQVFQSEEMRARYDASLRQASLSQLFQELAESMGHATKQELHQGQVLLFLEHARKEGWQAREALEHLKEHARQKRWMLTIPALDLDTEKVLCPNCETVNDKDQRYCTMCKQALFIECPRCKEQVSCECAACGNCGFAVGNRYLIDNLLEELGAFLRAGRLKRARQVIEEAEASWCQGHDRQDYRSQQIGAAKAHIRRLLAAQEQAQKHALEGLRELAFDEVIIDGQRWTQIAWALPEEGEVLLFKSAQPLQREGQVLLEAEADQLGQRLSKVDLADVVLDEWKPGTIGYYTPAILLQQRLFVGRSQRYACVEPVSQLISQHFGSAIRLRWIWPPDCQEVLVSYQHAQGTWQPAAEATSLHLSRAEYDRFGYYEIREATRQDYHITICALMQLGDEHVMSQGTHLLVRTSSKSVLTYELRPATRLRRRPQLHLSLDPPGPFPALILVSQQGWLPLGKADGELFYRIEAVERAKQRVVFELPDRSLAPKTFGKLFFEDDTSYHACTIHHPGMDHMRLS